ncbi:cell division protein FtsQ/DivIB [Ghiorsea bivora]|uniref:cell division protein FtsQ/DivIB n=1 Tax=Ghiorsea bivora TaxID=1485545 RepID=UPI00056E48D3|nr:cell division protein FtsQ/DivIB [Ghiorsea bivora]
MKLLSNIFRTNKKDVGNVRRKKKVKHVKRRMTWLKPLQAVLVASAVITVLGFSAIQLNQEMTVTHWQIDSPAHIKKPIALYFAHKQAFDFWHTRAAVIQRDLTALIPDIQRIEVSRVLPDGLLIKASARKPIALWENVSAKADKKVMLVDEQGVAYRPILRGENLDLPLFRLQPDNLKVATAVLHHLRVNMPERVQALSEVIVERQDWRLNFAHGEQWLLNQESLQDDLPKVLNILSQPRWARRHWRMDARIPERWFIRPAKQEVI